MWEEILLPTFEENRPRQMGMDKARLRLVRGQEGTKRPHAT